MTQSHFVPPFAYAYLAVQVAGGRVEIPFIVKQFSSHFGIWQKEVKEALRDEDEEEEPSYETDKLVRRPQTSEVMSRSLKSGKLGRKFVLAVSRRISIGSRQLWYS